MHDLVNQPMDFQPPEGLRGFLRAIVVTPVWAAALSGRLSTVSFFLSLRETEVTRGSGQYSSFSGQDPIYHLVKVNKHQSTNNFSTD
jgi:hypothetical protein